MNEALGVANNGGTSCVQLNAVCLRKIDQACRDKAKAETGRIIRCLGIRMADYTVPVLLKDV